MKSTTRGTLAAVLTGVAAAVGGAATSAAAVGQVPVPVSVPLDAVSRVVGTEAPQAGLEVPAPLLMPTPPEGPRFVPGHLMPERTLPEVPFTGALPGAHLSTPVPGALGDDHVGMALPANPLRTVTPGVALDAPLTRPSVANHGLPSLQEPALGVIAPVLQTVADGDLSTGPGL
ncbi:hypothetical protein [Streptomyces monashensis]|uniref:Secreted protein n=1 Tax=Streptomyces monashensis TaxID=1678012 RepID=A0A1S2NZE5_9ACTN|nr:hypothetical protein [Streptomyces monashensis]OIJ86632.1 hypothetical protein BIV23_43860 [Streptomyces monashensis]